MTWIDWLFRPLTWLIQVLVEASGESMPAGLEGVASIFLVTSVIVFFAIVSCSFLASALLLSTDRALATAFRWSTRGSDLKVHAAAAARYVAMHALLVKIHRWTGVVLGAPNEGSERIRDNGGHRLSRSLVRLMLSVPQGVGVVLRFAWGWIRYPVGAYLLAGAVWMQYRPGLDAAVNDGKGLLAALATPQGLAVLAAILAGATVMLDHGLTPRVRGRNAFQQQQAVEAERRLHALVPLAKSMASHLESGLDEMVRTHEIVGASAVERVTHGDFSVLDGHLHRLSRRRSPLSRLASHDADWESDEPLRQIGPEAEPWDPAADLRGVHLQITQLVQDDAEFMTTLGQSPSDARPFLWEVRTVHLTRHWTEDTLPTGAYRLSREHVERRAKSLIEDHQLAAILRRPAGEDRDKQLDARLDELVADWNESAHETAWRASVLHAKTARFVSSVHGWQKPAGWRRRLGLRLG